MGALINHTKRRITPRWAYISKTFAYTTFKAVWDSHLKQLKPFFFCWDATNNIADSYYVTLSPDTVFSAPLITSGWAESLQLTMEGAIE
jgi:hypothetical protein